MAVTSWHPNLVLVNRMEPNFALPQLRDMLSSHHPVPYEVGVVPGRCSPALLGGLGQLATSSSTFGGSCIVEEQERQEFLWQGFFLDPTQWWDNRPDKRSYHPDFRHRASKEALWLNNKYKPAWVDIQLAAWDAQVGNLKIGNWNTFCAEGELIKAVEALEILLQRGSHVDSSLVYIVLKRCKCHKDLALGRRALALALGSGCESNTLVANQMIGMYDKQGRLEEAMQVFAKVAAPNAFMWASIILAHVRQGRSTQAIKLYQQMRESTVKPDNHTFTAVLKACASALDLSSGKHVHTDILESGDEPDIFVSNCLVDMYAKCGSLVDARSVFETISIKDVVTWTAMISGYAQHGLGHDALALHARMQEECTTPPNRVTFVCLLQACASIGTLNQGRHLHAQIEERGLGGDEFLRNCLIDMYAKCGNLEDARRVFDTLQAKDLVTWTAMMSGYVQHGHGREALSLYASMQQEHMTAGSEATFLCLLQACAIVGALHQGKQLHAQIVERGLEADMVVSNCLVDMYAKCGSLVDACDVFDRMPSRDVVTWNALLNGYAKTSDAKMAMKCLEEMQQQGITPNGVTFLCLLVACSHEGLVNEGQKYFRLMVEVYSIAPTLHHYSCMVDLLGRSGHLAEAENMLQTMPFDNHVVGWTSLLSACKSHGDAERGRRCFDRLVELEPDHASAYVLMGSIYANAGRWSDVQKTESLRKSAGAKKKAAKACIEVSSNVLEFIVGEERADVSSKSSSVNSKLKVEGGHIAHTNLVLKVVPETAKEDALCGHAEKLALAYGILHTPDGTTLLVTKNLRMCNDCHSSTKIMSRLEKRDIIVRDAHRVHRFVDGICSCGDRQ